MVDVTGFAPHETPFPEGSLPIDRPSSGSSLGTYMRYLISSLSETGSSGLDRLPVLDYHSNMAQKLELGLLSNSYIL